MLTHTLCAGIIRVQDTHNVCERYLRMVFMEKYECGLDVIFEVFGTNPTKFAKEVGWSRYTVYDWVKGRRKIPDDKLEFLIEYFKVPKKYFTKNLTNAERLELQILSMEQEPEIEMPEYDDEGNLLGYSYYQPYSNEIRELSEIARRLQAVDKYKERVEKILHKAEREEIKIMDDEVLNGNPAPLHWQGYLQDAYLSRLERVLNLMEELNIDKFEILDDLLMYLEKCYGKDKSEWNMVRGFGTYLERSKLDEEFCEKFDELVKSRREGNKIDFLDW